MDGEGTHCAQSAGGRLSRACTACFPPPLPCVRSPHAGVGFAHEVTAPSHTWCVIAAGAKFCSSCGTQVSAPLPAPAAAPAAPTPAAPAAAPAVPTPAVPPPAKDGLKAGWGKLRKEMVNIIPQRPAEAGQQEAPKHVAQLKDDSLQQLLIEAFKIAEIRFQNFDDDGAGMLMFEEVKHDIGRTGFYDEGRLLEMWRRCDIDRSNTINFSEFLYLLYMWQYASDISSNISMAGPTEVVHPQVRCVRQMANGVSQMHAHDNCKDPNCMLSPSCFLQDPAWQAAHRHSKKVELYSAFFKFKRNSKIVLEAFSKMEGYYRKYDQDGNRLFSLQVFTGDICCSIARVQSSWN